MYILCIHSPTDVRWGPAKPESNWRKHGVRFSDAEAVPFDPNTVTVEDDKWVAEQRFVAVGADHRG